MEKYQRSQTKIICTIGPASGERDMLNKLLAAGMNIARINMSHGSQQQQESIIAAIREISRRNGQPVKILGDLQGPKIRLGEFANPQILQAGAQFRLTSEQLRGSAELASVDYPGLIQDVQPGNRIFINDGQVQLEVLATSDREILTQVLVGGEIGSHKGINVPGIQLSIPALTEKDRADLEFLAKHQVDYLACSFIRTVDNLQEIEQVLRGLDWELPLIAKLETAQGIDNFESIMENCFGVMLARGDLAVEIAYENIPIIQKAIISKAKQLQKPIIVATQMLESMTHNSSPTRAEMTDVANAVIDGAWGVMLSAETATGEHPVEVVEAMVKLVRRAEMAMADGIIDLKDIKFHS